MLKSFTDAAADAIGRAIATVQKEALHAEQLRDAEFRAEMAEFKAFVLRARTEVDEQVHAALSELRNGVDGEKGDPGDNGKDGAEGPPGRDGKDGIDGRDGQPGVPGRDGLNGLDGKDGAPGERGDPGEKGNPGRDARGFVCRGTYDAEATYEAGDVVMLNGSSWTAQRDAPGELPGDGWRLLAQRGERGGKGKDGERGLRGLPGQDGASIADISLEGFSLVVSLSDGSVITRDLSPAFHLYHAEAVR